MSDDRMRVEDQQTLEFWRNLALGLKDELVIRGDRIAELEAELARGEWEPVHEDYWGYINVEREGTVITVFAGDGVMQDGEFVVVRLPDGLRLCTRTLPGNAEAAS